MDEKVVLLVEEMREEFGSDFIDDPIKLCKFINSKINPIITAQKNKALLIAFEELERITGNLPIFSLSENLPEDEKKNRLLYFAVETMRLLLPIFQIGVRLIDFSQLELNEENTKLAESLQIPDEYLINTYFREWETQHALFVMPVYNKLFEKGLVQKRPKDLGNSFYAEALKDFFFKNEQLRVLCPILDFLDAKIRNAIVHLDFYIGEDRLYYFDRRSILTPHRNRVPCFYNNKW